MKICLVQSSSIKGEINQNIDNHLKLIRIAIQSKVDLIVFPELSITGYEPKLAKKLACDLYDDKFNSFQELANENNLTIGIGMPTNSPNGIHISMLFFQPHKERSLYSKQMLHDDELPYFVSGKGQTFLIHMEKKIAFGICYETLQREHIVKAKEHGADMYIASVAKPERGIKKAYLHFPTMAKDFNIPILMSNSVGYCDDFLSNGKSSVWNKDGKLMAQLDEKNQGLLIYDTQTELTEINQPKIVKGQLSDLEEIFQIYLNGKAELEKNNIYQWTDNYPTLSIIESDLKKGVLYVLKNNNRLIGAINLSKEQETQYELIDWKFDDSKVLVVHRLIIDPKYQRKGYGKMLMEFAENLAKKNYYSSIRLDAYSQNEKVITLYLKRNYLIRGEINFPGRDHPFYGLEKEI